MLEVKAKELRRAAVRFGASLALLAIAGVMLLCGLLLLGWCAYMVMRGLWGAETAAAVLSGISLLFAGALLVAARSLNR